MLGRILRGRYQIVEKLREGRFYDLYVARIAGSENRCVVKVLRDEFTHPDTMDRLKPDLGAVAALKNERIALLKDFGDFQNRIFLVEDYYEGVPLNEVLDPRRRFGALRALELGIRIADAVAFAHAKGVYHGFLTPQSVVVLSNLEVKIGDFYFLSSLVEMKKKPDSFRDCEDYVAPEVRRGAKPTFVSDVYSLGAILYALLTGVVPQRRPTLGDIADKRGGEPVPPRELNDAIPSLLDAAIKRALKWEPEGRYASVREMISELLLCRSTLLRAAPKEEPALGTVPAKPAAPHTAPPAPEAPFDYADVMRQDTGIVVSRSDHERLSEDMSARQKKKEQQRRFVPLIILLGVFMAIIVFSLGLIFSMGWLKSPLELAVPDVVGRHRVEAISSLGARGFNPEVTVEQSSDIYPEGYIVKQYPEAGMKVKEGRKVELVVSSGHKRVTVPSLEGISLRDAETLIENARLEVGEKSEVHSDEYAKGYVVEQHPAAGKEALAGAKVDIVVSSGREPSRALMPSVLKMDVDKAIETLNERNIMKIQIVDIATDAGPTGTVVSQSVLGDASIDKAKQVTLYVAVKPPSEDAGYAEGSIDIKMGSDKDNYDVLVRVIDLEGAKDVYHQRHKAGEDVSVPVAGAGETAVHVFVDGELVTEKILKGVTP